MFDSHRSSCEEDCFQRDTLKMALIMAHDMVYSGNQITVYSRHQSYPLLASIQWKFHSTVLLTAQK